MFHRHIEALLQHRILRLDVAPRPHILLSPHVQMIWVSSWLESALTRVKHNSPLQILIARQTRRLSTYFTHRFIITWAWVFRDHMSKETLWSLSSGGCRVESNASSSKDRVLLGSSLRDPFIFMRVIHSYVWSSIGETVLRFYLLPLLESSLSRLELKTWLFFLLLFSWARLNKCPIELLHLLVLSWPWPCFSIKDALLKSFLITSEGACLDAYLI